MPAPRVRTPWPLVAPACVVLSLAARWLTAAFQDAAEAAPAGDHVEQAAPGAREQADDRPCPLAQVTDRCRISADEIPQAEAVPGNDQHDAEGDDGDQCRVLRACPGKAGLPLPGQRDGDSSPVIFFGPPRP